MGLSSTPQQQEQKSSDERLAPACKPSSATAPLQPEDALKSTIMAGSSEMAALMRSHDWSRTPLGPVSGWPQSLRIIVPILLASRYAMWLGWGPELTFLYNDAYARMTLGKKHPWALGRPSREVWAEIWNEIGPRIRKVLETGEATWDVALLLFLERSGYPEETYHTFSYIPLLGDDGRIHGHLCVVTEETERVIGARRLASLRTLATALGTAMGEKDALDAIGRSLETNHKDLPLTLTYLFEGGGQRARLAGFTGIQPGHPAAPETIDLGADLQQTWPLSDLVSRKDSLLLENLEERFGALPTGAWDKSPNQALLVPITTRGQGANAGVFIAPLNPYRHVSAKYRGFVELVAGQIAAAIANARAYEDERRRAEALAQLDRAKTAFFSNISHELRTPLTLMLGPVETLLERGNGAPEDRQDLELLQRNAIRLLRLVNALLDFSRIEAGRMQARYEAVDLAQFTRELASVFQSAIERAGLYFSIDCPDLDEPVYVDREMWEKIVLNLISNAFKSTFDGEISVSIRPVSGKMEFVVRDTGTGIPRNEVPHIFERFRRIEGARRRTHEGSGIGLALVHELVSMHGGSIAVESELGKGATFRVRIPFGSAHLPADRVAHAAVEDSLVAGSAAAYVQEAWSWVPDATAGPRTLLSSLDVGDARALDAGKLERAQGRVLLVDDNRDMREYVARLLSPRFDVITAQNGKQAFELASAEAPDLVLTDVMMPESDGFQLLEALRQHPTTRTVPVVMLSARAGEDSRVEGLEAGADDYLVKPFTARELVATVESHIRLVRFRNQAALVESRLKEEVERARMQAAVAIEHISDGFVMADREWRLTYINAAAESVAGRPRDLLLGKPLWDIVPAVRNTELERQIRQVAVTRRPAEFEHFYELRQRWYALRVYPAHEGGLAIYIRDVENKKKAQQALQRAEQLATAGRLAASIAHELNNPLEAVTNLLYLAKSDSSTGAWARELLEVADKELQRLTHIARGSLKFYRQSTAPAETSLADLLETVLFLYEPRIQRSSVRLEKRIEAAPPLYCFAGEIQQVFANVIGNALDAVEPGHTLGIAVRAARDWKSLTTPGVRVTIADTGHGIAQGTLKRLFEPFFTTKGETGTGLGLWVTGEILKKHSAQVKVRSRASTGTVFSLFFPLDGVKRASDQAA